MPLPHDQSSEQLDEKKTTGKQPKSYHPALPAIHEAKENYESVTSDHVAFLTHIPLPPELETKEMKEVALVSWNVLEGDSFNGFAPLGKSEYGETEIQRNARYARIVESIDKFIALHRPQFITLQEISGNENYEGLYKLIQQKIGNQYGSVKFKDNVVDYGGCVTFYNLAQWEPEISSTTTRGSLRNDGLGGNKVKFKSISNEKLIIKITNGHPEFNHHPESHENRISKALKLEKDETLSVVVGDFNCCIAPLADTPKNITTSVAPNIFRDGKLQGACSIDGCFYSFGELTKQAEIQHLNPTTGAVYNEAELAALDLDSLSEKQQTEITNYSMAISVDSSFNTDKIIDEKLTIFEYQQLLRETLGDSTALVRPAKNINNEEVLAIAVSRENHLARFLLDVFSFQSNFLDNSHASTQFHRFLFKKSDVCLLPLLLNKEVLDFATSISKIQNNEVKQKFKNLLVTLVEEKHASDNHAAYAVTITHFNKIADQFVKTPQSLSAEELIKISNQLDAKLIDKPMSVKLKMAICGVLGALIGGVIGFAVTLGIGGFGGFVGALIGGAKGFAIGAGIGGGAGVIVGGVAGGYNRRKNYSLFQERQYILNKAQQQNNEPLEEKEDTREFLNMRPGHSS